MTISYPQLAIATPLRDIEVNQMNSLDTRNNVTTYFYNNTQGPEDYILLQAVCSWDFILEVYEGWLWEMLTENLLSTYK